MAHRFTLRQLDILAAVGDANTQVNELPLSRYWLDADQIRGL
jgi:hypothetical protein